MFTKGKETYIFSFPLGTYIPTPSSMLCIPSELGQHFVIQAVVFERTHLENQCILILDQCRPEHEKYSIRFENLPH